MHATLILLNLALAFRARLCVELDPDCAVVITSLDFIEPSVQKITVDGSVGFLQALEAPVITAFTNDISVLH